MADIELGRPADLPGLSQAGDLPRLSSAKSTSLKATRSLPGGRPAEDQTAGESSEKDVEKADSSEDSEDVVDENLVTWDGPDDPTNPRNWSSSRKWMITFVTSCFTFISPVSSSMLSPALPAISKDLGIESSTVELMVVSIFVLGYAIGPLLMGPLSEVYGRKLILRYSNLVYLIFNTACGFCRTGPEIIAFRFLGGLAGSAPLAVGGGLLSDVWTNEERGKALGTYTLMPLLGPAIGPIAAGFIVQYSDWRWCFYSVSIAGCFVQLLAQFFLWETSHRAILRQKQQKIQKATGNDLLHTKWDQTDETVGSKLRVALIRPFRLLATQPIVQFLGLYMAFLFGLIYLVLSTFPRLWSAVYHERVDIGGLNYVSAGLGFFIASQINSRFQDRLYLKLTERAGGDGVPEYRIPFMVPAAVLVPIGIFIYAWTSEYATHWIGPNIGIFLLSGGMIVCNQCMQIYIVQTYTHYAASALAAVAVLRCTAAFTFPLFATQMYDSLGYGWGNSLLGFIAIGIGWPAVVIFWKYGKTLREKSPYAAVSS
ncbi:MFS multidrug transporter [Thozetella sp. PMI_491]|nr:MFS multidrug transporter [Thozetella sp. PMI_491]